MANNIYGAIGLTGGGTGALDAIDGAGLADKDMAIVFVQGQGAYFYVLDDDLAGSEVSPSVIVPDANGGNKRWVLHGIYGTVFNPVSVTSTPKNMTAAECVSQILYVNASAAATINLPAVSGVAPGAYFMIYSTAAYVLTVDPNASDRIILNGTALDDGDKIVSSGAAGDYIALHRDGTDGWTVVGRSGYWVDGGA